MTPTTDQLCELFLEESGIDGYIDPSLRSEIIEDLQTFVWRMVQREDAKRPPVYVVKQKVEPVFGGKAVEMYIGGCNGFRTPAQKDAIRFARRLDAERQTWGHWSGHKPRVVRLRARGSVLSNSKGEVK